VVSPHTTPMRPPPSVSVETDQSLPKLYCCMTLAFPRQFRRRCSINASPYLPRSRLFLIAVAIWG
jgi:hypothetical protein